MQQIKKKKISLSTNNAFIIEGDYLKNPKTCLELFYSFPVSYVTPFVKLKC